MRPRFLVVGPNPGGRFLESRSTLPGGGMLGRSGGLVDISEYTWNRPRHRRALDVGIQAVTLVRGLLSAISCFSGGLDQDWAGPSPTTSRVRYRAWL